MYDFMASAKRYIMTIHGLSFLQGSIDKRYFKKMLILKKRINKLSKIITVSYWAKNSIMKFFKLPEEKIKVIYNCVDRKFFNERKTEYDDRILKMFGITKPYFIHVSSGDKTKNIEYILKAMKYSKRKDYLLVLVGLSPTNRKRIIRHILHQGLAHRVKIIPPIRNDHILAALYRGAYALIMPSYHESFSFALVEAMSTGTLCIVSRRAALPEIAGDAAIYIDIKKPTELSSLMDDICKGKYDLLNLNGIKRVKKLFNPETFALKHIRVYKEVLDELKESDL